MIEQLRRYFKAPDVQVASDEQEGNELENTENLEVTETGENTLETVTAERDALLAQVADLSAQLESFSAIKAEMENKQKELQLQLRKEKLVSAIGTDKADALLVATGSLDDVAFETLVGAMEGSLKTESETTLFKEEGADGEVVAESIEDKESDEMKLLRAKYAAQ